MEVFIGDYAKSAKLKSYQVKDFKQFCNNYLNNCIYGEKDGSYFTTASEIKPTLDQTKHPFPYLHRNNKTHLKSWLICIDGDQSVGNTEGCIPLKEVHDRLSILGINHAIYSSHSHNPPDKHKWRLVVPCELSGIKVHRSTVANLHAILYSAGLKDLVFVTESSVMCQFWYLPRSNNPDNFEYYDFHEGGDFQAIEEYPEIWNDVPKANKKKSDIKSENFFGITTEEEIVKTILNGVHPLHEAMNKFIYGNIKDGRTPAAVKATMHGLTSVWNLNDDRLLSRKNDIDRLVDYFYEKHTLENNTSHWDEEEKEKDRIFTDYPDQGGNFEKIVQCCMDWMIYPNRQIAVTAARALISALGARVYNLPTGSGIALTALITGRSTIGKSNVKKFFIWVMDNFQLARVSSEYLGAQYYTSVKNLVEDIKGRPSLLSVRTESGQSDKSSAGDMSRVMMYELESSTASGMDGYISAGAQNDKIPALFSPGITTIRESVAKIQNDADAANQSTVAGVTGRRSLVLIDPIKQKMNRNRITKVPDEIKRIITEIFRFSSDDRRKDCTVPLAPNLWVNFTYEDEDYINDKIDVWRVKGNKAAMEGDDYEATFYGRLGEKVPAYAGLLAVADNPKAPVITCSHINIAEESLKAELHAHHKQSDAGELDDPLSKLITKICSLFQGSMRDLIKYYKPRLRDIGKKELADGAIEWVPVSKKLQWLITPLDTRNKDQFYRSLKIRLHAMDIELLSKNKTQDLYGHTRMTLRRM